MIEASVANGEVLVSACGALAAWTRPESTGRSPQDTWLVQRPGSREKIDWNSPNNLPMDPETFGMLLEDALAALAGKPKLVVTDRMLGADPAYGLTVRTVAPKALTALFTDNMFRPAPAAGGPSSRFAGQGYTLLALPDDKLDPKRYAGRLRVDPTLGGTSTMAVALDVDHRVGIVYGSAYCGSIKKMMFTAMNFLLPQSGVLSLHASANEGPDGKTALLLGLSGTGKTTLSADPRRRLLGDDEHGWSDQGIFNLENGCYAKLIRLNPEKEPEIHDACFHSADWREHGSIIENALMFPNGTFDLDDTRLTPNSRGSFPLSAMRNVKTPPVGRHPATILFLTADANGVLPPVARLTPEQAMLWFLMGYTSKLEGTERGVREPQTAFSRFFGSPFMPLKPQFYADLLGRKLKQHGTRVFLVNTGWSGGPFGVGKRMDIQLTRTIVEAALSGALDEVPVRVDPRFHLAVPQRCPGIPDPAVLQPRGTWADPAAYDRRADRLAQEFLAHFGKNYGGQRIEPGIAAVCPGR